MSIGRFFFILWVHIEYRLLCFSLLLQTNSYLIMFRNISRNYPCDICKCANYSNVQRQRHKAREHYCYTCEKYFLNKPNHNCVPVQQGLGGFDPSPFYLSQAGLDSFQVYRLEIDPAILVITKLIKQHQADISKILEHCLLRYKNIKSRIVIRANLVQLKTGEKKQTDLGYDYGTLFHKSNIKKFIFDQTSRIIVRLNFYNTGGSSWTVERFPFLDLHVTRYQPLRGGQKLPTPSCYSNKLGLINIPTEEKLCFPYCAIACYKGIRTKKEGEKLSLYREFMAENFDWESRKCKFIEFNILPQERGVAIEDIPAFTRANETFSVNVYAHDDEENTIYPILVTAEEKQYHMDLMILVDEETGASHYVYIYDIDLLLIRKNCDKTFRCKSCLQGFRTRISKEEHSLICCKNPPQRLVFPIHQFVNYDLGANEIRHTFWVSADFETYMKVIII
jgi:hypothetical protein